MKNLPQKKQQETQNFLHIQWIQNKQKITESYSERVVNP